MSTFNPRKKQRRLNRREQHKVEKWLREAYNIGFSGLGGVKLTAGQHELRRTVIEDALIKAVQDYDATKGASFSTFLYRKVRWAILDANKPKKNKVANARTFTDIMADE
jgi:hypothetical protein